MSRRNRVTRPLNDNPSLTPPGDWGRADLLLPLAVFVVLFVVKLALIVPVTVGPTVSDELFYWSFVQDLAEGQVYESTQYPPGYPLALVPAFLLPGDPYPAILVLNAFYSSLAVFPVFWIARLVMRARESLVVAILHILIPFHYVAPRMLLSENTYFPLLFAVVFMMLWRPRRGVWAWDVGTGFALAALYLTRYVSLPLIPALLIIWWMREWHHSGRRSLDAQSWARFGAMGLAGALTFVPWVLAHTNQGTELMLALGFGITSNTDPAQLTASRLWIYVRMYLGYYALLGAPVLGLVLLAFRQAWRERALTVYTRLVAAVGLISLSLLVAVSRHSWRAHYNYPDPQRIMGRYTTYVAVLFLIIAVAAFVRARLEQREGTGMGWPAMVGWVAVLPLVLVSIGYRTVLGDWAMPFTPESITDRGSIDAFRIILMGRWFAVTVSAALIGTVFLIKRFRGRDAVALALLVLAIAVYSLVGVPRYFDQMARHQSAASQVHEIIRFYDEYSVDHVTHVIVGREAVDASGMIPETLRLTYQMFAEGRALFVTVEHAGGELVIPRPLGEGDSVFLEAEVVPAGSVPAGVEPLDRWEMDGAAYALVPRTE